MIDKGLYLISVMVIRTSAIRYLVVSDCEVLFGDSRTITELTT